MASASYLRLNKLYGATLITIMLLVALGIIDPASANIKLPADTSAGYSTWDLDMINSEASDTTFTGQGAYIAVLDTGLVPNWSDYFPEERIATKLGIGFREEVHFDPVSGEYVGAGQLHQTSFIGSVGSSHGTHVTSTIIGYAYFDPRDGIPPIIVRGVAPKATIIPVKVLDTYFLPGITGPDGAVFGTDSMVAAGINYATDLKLAGYSPMIVTMSLGGPEPSVAIEDAIDRAIANGVIVLLQQATKERSEWGGQELILR